MKSAVCTVLLMAAALVPNIATNNSNHVENEDGPIILLLGDSMLSGQGIHAYVDQNPLEYIGNPAEFHKKVYKFGGSRGGHDCWRENEKGAVAWIAEGLNNRTFINLACAGARAEGIMEQWDYAKARFDLEGSTILLSLGANDSLELVGVSAERLLSMKTLRMCFQGFLPFQIDANTMSEWEAVESRIEAILGRILEEAPTSATIRVIGYPLQFRPLFGFV